MIPVRDFIICALVFLLVAGLTLPCRADTLDDASIRKFYADSKSVMRQPDKLQGFLEAHLDDNYSSHDNILQTIDDAPPQSSVEDEDKAQTIADGVKGAKIMTFDTLQNNILSIKYADDHNAAYVSDSTLSSGLISLPTANGVTTLHYQEGAGCVDRLAIVANTLKMMQSACNSQLTIKK